MSEPFLGEIRPWACNFAPRGWAFCDGQLMAISQNTALFSILGVAYGGDGRTTFGLPDLAGRVPVGPGAGPGLTPRQIGERGGEEGVTLTAEQIPAHAHAMRASSGRPSSDTPGETRVLTTAGGITPYSDQTPDAAMAPDTLQPFAGGGQPHDNLMPFQAVNVCIALEGVFPPRE